MATDDAARRKQCELEWGVKMGEMELIYLEDQRTNRLYHTQSKVDPVWYRAAMRAKRIQERIEKDFQSNMEERNFGKTFEQVEHLLLEEGALPSSPEGSLAGTPRKVAPIPVNSTPSDLPPPKKQKRLFDDKEEENDSMPRNSDISESQRELLKMNITKLVMP